jgi:4-diphosphocytidyl-2-C-methyl-D-erythritol kinase
MSLRAFAPAKINLSLRVGPPNGDGRHPLDSLVCFTRSCGDRLTFETSSDLSLTITGPFGSGLAIDETNLVLRAARLLKDQANLNAGAAITLTKRLPIASGIGGGSADAAATLVGLNQLWQADLPLSALAELGATLGADVPACVYGTPLRMVGTGEETHSVGSLPRLGIVLINPLVACPTGPVYRRYDELGRFADTALASWPNLSTPPSLLAFLSSAPNDLEAAAITLVPEIQHCLDALATTDALWLARMSGSGATCFGLYPDLTSAQSAMHQVKNQLASLPIWVEADEIN